MRLTKWAVGVVLVLVASSILACSASFSTAKLGETWLSTDEAGKEKVTGFTPDQVFYAYAELKNAPDDTKVKATWTAIAVEGADPNTVIDTAEVATGKSPVFFTLTNDGPWPVGSYKVDMYLDDKLAKTIEFKVE